MAIAACFVFQREISRSVFWDFFDSIGPTPTSAKVCWCAAIWDTADITNSRLGHLASRFTRDQARRWFTANLRL